MALSIWLGWFCALFAPRDEVERTTFLTDIPEDVIDSFILLCAAPPSVESVLMIANLRRVSRLFFEVSKRVFRKYVLILSESIESANLRTFTDVAVQQWMDGVTATMLIKYAEYDAVPKSKKKTPELVQKLARAIAGIDHWNKIYNLHLWRTCMEFNEQELMLRILAEPLAKGQLGMCGIRRC